MLRILFLAATASALVVPMPQHASIVGTNPEDGSTITTVPAAFTITASEDILSVEGSTSNTLLVTDQAGGYYGDGCMSVDGPTLSSEAALGEDGLYTVRYSLASADGHVIEGATTFEYRSDGSSPVAESVATAPTCGAAEASPTPSPSDTPSAAPSVQAGTSSTAPSDTAASSTAPQEGASSGDEGTNPAVFIGAGIAIFVGVAGVLVATWRRGLQKERRDAEPVEPDDR